MTFYKFLRTGAVGPYSGFRWPTPVGSVPGEWVEVEGELRLASNGIHACRVGQLPYWVDAELWEAELDGPVEETPRHVLGRRGRLIGRVEGWQRDTADELAHACVERSRAHAVAALRARGIAELAAAFVAGEGAEGLMSKGYGSSTDVPDSLADVVLDAGDTGFAVHSGLGACLAAYLSARTAGSAASVMGHPADGAEHAERRWQATWLRKRLGLRAGS